MIKNYMEDAVDHLLPSVLKDYDNICKCEKCIDDIKAMTLNKVKPMYTVTDKGNMYVKLGEELEIQFKTDIVLQLIKSIEKVSKKPQHLDSSK